MQIRKLVRMSGLALAVATSTSTFAADYDLDLSHSFIQFRISHLGYSVLNGRFNDFGGTLQWDKAAPEASTIALTIKTASIDSNWAERDKHIRSPDFLDVEKYPEASFKSTKFTGDATAGKLEGELTLHGVTKPITLEVKAVGEGEDPWGGYRAGFTGTTTLKRSDFGISYNLGPSSETMDFDLFIEGIRKK
jgi:polyisoprenoid-binding protein YceI